MNLALKLDRIAARADELRDMLTQGLSGEAYVTASRELADIEPVVARIGDLRAAEHAMGDAESMLADPEMRELAEAQAALFRIGSDPDEEPNSLELLAPRGKPADH